MQKPDPEIFRRTVLRAGGDPAEAVMVGDSATDIRTARAAKVPVVAVDFGYTDVPIETFAPDRLISSFAQLPAALGNLGLGRTWWAEIWRAIRVLSGTKIDYIHCNQEQACLARVGSYGAESR